MALYRSISKYNKTKASNMSSPHQYDDYIDEIGYDTVGDSTLPLHHSGKPQQHLAWTSPLLHFQINDYHRERFASAAGSPALPDEVLQARNGVAEEEFPMQLNEESDDEMIMDLLGEQLEEEMMAIEEGDGMYQQETSVRIIILGSANEKNKRVCIQKIARALLIRHRHKRSSSNNFKERKHHVVRETLGLDGQPLGDEILCVQTFEDIGLSIIEADFSWSTGHRKQVLHYANLLFQHCEAEQVLSSQCARTEEVELMLCPQSKQDSIVNICIYLYDGNQYLAAVEEDLDELLQLQTMGASILPILVGNVVDASVHRAQFADVLARYHIRPKTFSTLLVDVGHMPSFVRRTTSCCQVSNGHTLKEKQWIGECGVSSHTPSAPYFDILTIHQFAALNDRIIAKHIFEDCAAGVHSKRRKNKGSMIHLGPSSTSESASQAVATASAINNGGLLSCLLVFILGTLLTFTIVARCWNRRGTRDQEPTPLTSLVMHVSLDGFADGDRLSIQVDICGRKDATCERHQFPIPICTQPGALPLGTIHINARSSQIDLIHQGPALICPTPTRTSSKHNAYQLARSSYNKDKQYKYWVSFHQITIFLLEHRSRIRSIFTKSLG